ncbi:unnamed protein product [Rangifer tarandus platyrhynchus]|uniref:Uncharacterized protein n=1 Tax=Rangifer tarandus platyrhynchus TaxID=3082113 RepID=A0ABN9A438_RANTA|nr:unnamed protein product [Rangifer tarandus platyrhynchus]
MVATPSCVALFCNCLLPTNPGSNPSTAQLGKSMLRSQGSETVLLCSGFQNMENGILGCHHCIPSELLPRWPSKDIGAPEPCDVKFGKYPPKH